MITVTAAAFHEKVHLEADEIILNGPPTFLTGNITIGNKADEVLFINEVPLTKSKQSKGQPAVSMPETFKFNTSLNPGEERIHSAWHQMHPQTAPGTYEGIIHVGGQQKKLKMVVHENVEIDIQPLTIYFQGVVPGKSYSKELLFTNKGNVPVTVPDIKHNTILDFDYICRAFSIAIRSKGNEGFVATMDEVTRNIHKEMADWAVVKLDESGQIVEPGKAVALHFTLTLPKNVDPKRDYFGDVRLWDKVLCYMIKSQ